MGTGLVALVRNIDEAQKSTAQLDVAFSNASKTLGLTREELEGLATEMQRTTTFSDDLVKEGEAILLTFTKVRGDAFQRTIKVAADLSARLGTDLKASIRQVGLALQDPVAGLTLLRRSGISFSEEQKNVIKRLLETNQAAKAQELILAELEKRFGGSASAARNTLGGALSGLKNSFSDLFESNKEGTASAVTAINDISRALNDPDLKSGINFLIAAFAKLVELTTKALGLIGQAAKASVELGKTLSEVKNLEKAAPTLRTALSNPFAALVGAQFQLNRASSVPEAAVGLEEVQIDVAKIIQPIEEINITVRKIVDANADLMREFQEDTKTATQRAAGDYIRFKETLEFLFSQGALGQGEAGKAEFNKRLGAQLDDILPEFDLNEIRAKYITLKKETTELGEFMKGVWQQVGRGIQSTLSDAIYDWKLSWKSLLDITRRALADITSAIIVSGIKGALKSQLSSSGSSSSGTSSFLAGLGKLFGLAGGGRYDGLRMVGEDGPELVGGSGRVWNQRQMAFAGMGGAQVTYAPTFNLNIESSGDKESEARMAQYVETRLAQSQGEFVHKLRRSGVEVRG